MSIPKSRPVVSKVEPEKVQPQIDRHAPRRLTLAENVTLTLKLLGGLALLGAALWAIDLWTVG